MILAAADVPLGRWSFWKLVFLVLAGRGLPLGNPRTWQQGATLTGT